MIERKNLCKNEFSDGKIMSSNHDRGKLPSLRALQVFEAAARHRSFTGAAGELGVTQGAVSRQVQELEHWLGQRLFRRSGPKLMLTATGKALGAETGRALDVLRTATDAARPSSDRQHVTLSMLPAVAAKWLAPRLARFVRTHPEIDLRVTVSRHFVDFAADEVDAAIRYGKGNWPGLSAELLARETVTPVCTRGFAEGLGLKTPEDLLNVTLLHPEIDENWRAWFRAAGMDAASVPRGPKLGDDTATLQAAVDGQGVALGRSVLVADDIRAQRLIAPFQISLEASYSYWFVTPADTTASDDLRAVLHWLKQEFNQAE